MAIANTTEQLGQDAELVALAELMQKCRKATADSGFGTEVSKRVVDELCQQFRSLVFGATSPQPSPKQDGQAEKRRRRLQRPDPPHEKPALPPILKEAGIFEVRRETQETIQTEQPDASVIATEPLDGGRISKSQILLERQPNCSDNRVTIATQDHGGPLPTQEEKIGALFADIRKIDDPRERLATVSNLYRAARKEAATAIQPSILSILKESIALDFGQKTSVSELVNRVLDDTGLAIEDPESKFPARLDAQQRRTTSPTSTLRLQDTRRGVDGRQHKVRVQDLDLEHGTIKLIDVTTERVARKFRQ